MRVLVLGVSGMLGHKVLEVLAESAEVSGSTRPNARAVLLGAGFPAERLIDTEGLPQGSAFAAMLERVEPEVVVNCIGAVKQGAAAQDPVQAITINSLFPHQIADQCSASGVRLIHVSTDCVFAGTTGYYTEASTPDATDLYGRSKLLGEVADPPHLTLRTSIIGRELAGDHGLVEWFLSQRGSSVRGYTSAHFSGLSTLALARIIASVVTNQPDLSGLFHVAAERIDKCTLLHMLDAAYASGTTIVPDDRLKIDRSLDGSKFRHVTEMVVPTWAEMIAEMAADSDRFGYDRLRHLSQRS